MAKVGRKEGIWQRDLNRKNGSETDGEGEG